MKTYTLLFLIPFFLYTRAAAENIELYAWNEGQKTVFSIQDKTITGYGRLYDFLIRTDRHPQETGMTVYADSGISFQNIANLKGLLNKIGYLPEIFIVYPENSKMTEYKSGATTPFNGKFPKRQNAVIQ